MHGKCHVLYSNTSTRPWLLWVWHAAGDRSVMVEAVRQSRHEGGGRGDTINEVRRASLDGGWWRPLSADQKSGCAASWP
jgi:hypothetical protein